MVCKCFSFLVLPFWICPWNRAFALFFSPVDEKNQLLYARLCRSHIGQCFYFYAISVLFGHVRVFITFFNKRCMDDFCTSWMSSSWLIFVTICGQKLGGIKLVFCITLQRAPVIFVQLAKSWPFSWHKCFKNSLKKWYANTLLRIILDFCLSVLKFDVFKCI